MPVSLPGGVQVGGGGVTLPGGVGVDWGKRKRSACRHVAAEDVPGFRAGRVAAWIIGERQRDIADAFGLFPGTEHPPTAAELGMTLEQVADLHLSKFVPLCDRLEGGEANYTTDPNAGTGLQIYEAARGQFRDQVRSGRISWAHAPRGGTGGDILPGTGTGEGTTPTQAGFGIAAIVGLGLAAVLFSR